jgi:Putative Ig domain/Spy0128-like isopeptide containing domain
MTRTRHQRHFSARLRAALIATFTLAAALTASVPAALAAGTTLFNQPFHNNTVNGPVGSVIVPTAPTGTNFACLTAAGNSTANPLASCKTATDAQGSGKLRLTSNATSLEGGVFASSSVPTSQGLDVTFNTYQYGGTSADGIAFALAAANPADPQVPSVIGQAGGDLGYSALASNNPALPGLANGYLGIGLDVFGNYSNKFEGTGCTDPANISSQMPGQVVVRGPGNGTVGYCALQSSAATATSAKLTLRATTRAASVVPVEVVINPTAAPLTTPTGLTAPAGSYNITFTPVGGSSRSLIGPLPTVPSGLYPASWVNSAGLPRQLTFGWVGSTGASTDYHEIDNVVVTTLNPVPQLAVSQTSYSLASLGPGSPVTYTVTASASGATESQPVTITQTLPSGVLPVSAYGTGWTCGTPSGQQISCTSTGATFTSGTITVNGVVNSSAVTQSTIQGSTKAIVSSSDGNPATATSAPAGTVPLTPVVLGLSPTNGAAGGGNDVVITGTNLTGATAVEIGTTAEFNAGTPTTLVPCAGSATSGCFTVVSATSIDIPQMPAHAAASGVTVKVVSLGIGASGSYTYNPGPALLFPAPPGGETGVAYSNQLTVTGGTSPFTWSISSGSLPPGITLGASTGLLSGTPTTAGTYNFTVKVTDKSGLTDTKPVTLTIIPGPSMTFSPPPQGWTRTVYLYTLTASGGTSPLSWTVTSGSLPSGIILSNDGNLTGTPTVTGTFSFTVKVTDANGQSASQATSLTIAAGVAATFAPPPEAGLGVPYSYTLTASGGTTPYTWSVNSGTLPPGITLSSAGVLSGTPTATGTYSFSVNVIDKNNGVSTTSVSFVVASALTFTFTTLPSGTVGTAYSTTLTATGGNTPYTWSISEGSLPAGLTLSTSTGVISGIPTTPGTSSFTARVADPGGQATTKATSISIGGGVLSMTAPSGATLPATSPGGSTSAQFGTVTVTDQRGGKTAAWTATVSATVFVTGTGSAGETIPLSQITYWSGPATATTGTGTFTPGQATARMAVSLTDRRTAFTLASGSGVNSASWRPTLSVGVPSAAVAGTYTATITHSVT